MQQRPIIPNRLREIRKERNLTQKQVAEMLGLKIEDRLSHWENGVSIPSLLNLLKLAKLYQVTIEDIFYGI